ncbi:MAG: porin family protein [Pseudoflavonifractor sp.]|nr:porin family protein [Alloprevotella sp.]MCM1117100.1 porin family protein [Pseudoflavonifractor sp.]
MTSFKTFIQIPLIIIMMIAMSLPAAAEGNSVRGQKSMGLYGGYSTRAESGVAGLYFNYRFSQCFRLSPSADYTFRNRGEDAFNINLDAQVPLALDVAGRINFYPLAGVGYSVFNRKEKEMMLRKTTDNSHRTDRFGLNVGAGLEYFVSPTLRLALEGKWRWRTDFSTGIFNITIGYRF